jgi:hypothetical protein
MHRSKMRSYSITSSARASSVGGTARPSILAVWWLMTSSNFDACTTGRSAGVGAFEDSADIDADLAVCIQNIRSVADQPAASTISRCENAAGSGSSIHSR